MWNEQSGGDSKPVANLYYVAQGEFRKDSGLCIWHKIKLGIPFISPLLAMAWSACTGDLKKVRLAKPMRSPSGRRRSLIGVGAVPSLVSDTAEIFSAVNGRWLAQTSARLP